VLIYTHYLQQLMTNVNQFKVGLETDKGHFTLKVKTAVAARNNFNWYGRFVGIFFKCSKLSPYLFHIKVGRTD
jgi:hypothetical protein